MEDTNHTTLHKALEQSFNRALVPYEVHCKATAKSYYTVSESTGEITLTQPLVLTECTGPEGETIPEGWISALIQLPTQRENGADLPREELEYLECRVRDTNGDESDYLQTELPKE